LLVATRLVFRGNSSATNKFKSAAQCAALGLPTITGGRRIRLVA
jgi:hypothetical protein